VGVLLIVGLLPLAAMLANSFFVDGVWTLATYRKLFGRGWRQWIPMGHSLTLATLTAGCATLVGVPLGLLFEKTDLPLRHVFLGLLVVPLLLPPYVLAVCWFNLLTLAVPAGRSMEVLSHWLFGLPGCVWVLVTALMPVVMILTVVYLHAVNPRLEEAARMFARWPAVFRHVTLPLIRSGIVFAGMLVFLLALGEVGVPMFLRYSVFPVETMTQFAAFYNFGAAAAAAVPLLAVALFVLALERRYLRESTYRLQPTTPARQMRLIPLGRWRIPLFAFIALLTAVAAILPLLGLVVSSVSPPAYGEAWNKAADSLFRSLVLAGLGATLLTLVGFFCGYLIHHRSLALWRSADTLTLLLFTLPGTVLGVGLIALWNHRATGFVYGSIAMVLLAYVAQYTALTSRITLATLANVPQSLEEAAQLAGAPWLARIWHVVVPAALPGVLAAWLGAFIFCLRDLGASMLVYPAGQDTLPERIFTLMANGAPSLISALCVMLVATTLLALIVLGTLFRSISRSR
jgi:iron(III) transport system permease protein